MTHSDDLPIAVIGGGPVGLAAAAHCLGRGLPVRVYEAGSEVGANILDWGHVRLFSPWQFNIDPAARRLLQAAGWQEPPTDVYPTGRDLVDSYLAPLAQLPSMAGCIETGAQVTAVGRQYLDKVVTKGREARPFTLTVIDRNGEARRDLARAVIDASGTWTSPNPLGAGGTPAIGEDEQASRIAYGIPDVLGRDREAFAGRTVLVVGAGHSAANVLLDLSLLAEVDHRTQLVWVTRGTDLSRVYGGGAADQLAERGALGSRLRRLVDSGRVTLVTGYAVTAVREDNGRLIVKGETTEGVRTLGPVDRIVAVTGQRPDFAMTREVRLDLDPWLESTKALGPLVDPNLHSCGSVPPHGHRELAHPEASFYTVGIKSYGRAPTFLMMTGYEQVRSVAAALAGDIAAADKVELVLPETGICSTSNLPGEASSCCVPAPAEIKSSPCCGPAQEPAPIQKASGCCSPPA